MKKAFQSPRSGKFVSDFILQKIVETQPVPFQSPRSGKFVSDRKRLPRKIRGLGVSIP